MDLEQLREKIDGIDDELVRLFEERMRLSEEVAEYKLDSGRGVFDRKREENKLNSVREKLANEENTKGVTELFKMLMHLSRRRQNEILARRGVSLHLSFRSADTSPSDDVCIIYSGGRKSPVRAGRRGLFWRRGRSLRRGKHEGRHARYRFRKRDIGSGRQNEAGNY